MPSLNETFLKQLKDDYKQYKIFIETGTFQGGTTFAMESIFEKIYTIEFSEKYYNETKKRYNGSKIEFIHGDSSKEFVTLLPKINEKSILFLDGHWSSADTGRSAKDCPLIEEIILINHLFKKEAIVIIDDYRLFGKSSLTGMNEDWSDISKDKIVEILKNRITDIYHLDSEYSKDDRLIIHIRSIE
jgi:hypothetical protein